MAQYLMTHSNGKERLANMWVFYNQSSYFNIFVKLLVFLIIASSTAYLSRIVEVAFRLEHLRLIYM